MILFYLYMCSHFSVQKQKSLQYTHIKGSRHRIHEEAAWLTTRGMSTAPELKKSVLGATAGLGWGVGVRAEDNQPPIPSIPRI